MSSVRRSTGPTPPGYVGLTPVFHSPVYNKFGTAVNIWKGPDEYLVHLADQATGVMNMGFMTKPELIRLRDALIEELK